ncbi:putative metal-dependent hydrolase [Aurantibacter crassamenti]|uniref:YfiT family bacillithiol transferase n=1 Tax=Aurantibacter crassamenti TaxID=1837375 RepID=UPI0019392D7F|nr:putative metal-dependent hydrolase [Aurantibacter crassamenti]MBM1106369.1 putative metal-dependent hydrolase [Aurantibacter crassamenti]
MDKNDLEKLKYPIGTFKLQDNLTDAFVDSCITELAEYPKKLAELVEGLTEDQLNTPYRPEGWTVRQLVHHIADSHHHSYTRFKWALTENKAVIKAYEEKEWSKLIDANTAPIQLSLTYLSALHAKIVYLLRSLSSVEMQYCYTHPENNTEVTVQENICKYAWHGRHHYSHIENLIKREGWY